VKEGTPTIDERMMPIDVQALRQQLLRTPLAHHVDALIQATEQSMASRLQGRMPEWNGRLGRLKRGSKGLFAVA